MSAAYKSLALPVLSLCVSSFAFGVAMSGAFIKRSKSIPSVEKVQSGSIPPSKLEIIMQDGDQNGEKETVLMIDKTPYLLLYDENNNPMLRPYTVEGPKILYQK